MRTDDSQEAKTEKVKPEVQLVGEDGNAHSILGRVARVLRRAGYTQEEISQYREEATSGDYDHLLQVTMSWCHVT